MDVLAKAITDASTGARRFIPIIGGRAVSQAAHGEADGDGSAPRTEESPATLLADAVMLLRDAPLMNLMLHETVRALMSVVDRMGVPKDDERLCSLSRVRSLMCIVLQLSSLTKPAATLACCRRPRHCSADCEEATRSRADSATRAAGVVLPHTG